MGELADDLGGLVGDLGGLVSGLGGQSESHWRYPSPSGTFRSLIPFDQTFNLCTIANGQTSAVPEARQRSRGPVNGLGARQRSWERSSTVWELVSGPGSVRQRSELSSTTWESPWKPVAFCISRLPGDSFVCASICLRRAYEDMLIGTSISPE